MMNNKKISLFMIAAIVTVLYFWYLGYNVMILDNPLVSERVFDNSQKIVYLSSWE